VSIQGRAILYPDDANECLKAIQTAESKDIRLVIETLSQAASPSAANTA
jgi:hypothetical protein